MTGPDGIDYDDDEEEIEDDGYEYDDDFDYEEDDAPEDE
jgi:hypothetical protein